MTKQELNLENLQNILKQFSRYGCQTPQLWTYFHLLGLFHKYQIERKQLIQYLRKPNKTTDEIALFGCMYYCAIGTETDSLNAYCCFKNAGEKGSNVANRFLGYCYTFERGVNKDIHAAIKSHRKVVTSLSNENFDILDRYIFATTSSITLLKKLEKF
ncbi:hypothetical protein G9A89_021120 [Geosiphon pyriformis]|nr:hypothetical protein G9A89_021120 [Geosiphon pyriformis]